MSLISKDDIIEAIDKQLGLRAKAPVSTEDNTVIQVFTTTWVHLFTLDLIWGNRGWEVEDVITREVASVEGMKRALTLLRRTLND